MKYNLNWTGRSAWKVKRQTTGQSGNQEFHFVSENILREHLGCTLVSFCEWEHHFCQSCWNGFRPTGGEKALPEMHVSSRHIWPSAQKTGCKPKTGDMYSVPSTVLSPFECFYGSPQSSEHCVEFARAQVASRLLVCGNILWEASGGYAAAAIGL